MLLKDIKRDIRTKRIIINPKNAQKFSTYIDIHEIQNVIFDSTINDENALKRNHRVIEDEKLRRLQAKNKDGFINHDSTPDIIEHNRSILDNSFMRHSRINMSLIQSKQIIEECIVKDKSTIYNNDSSENSDAFWE